MKHILNLPRHSLREGAHLALLGGRVDDEVVLNNGQDVVADLDKLPTSIARFA